MILCIDVGNTQIQGGVFHGEELSIQFRKTSRQKFSSDEIGLFLINVLRENKIDVDNISGISICSVVPGLNHSLSSGCIKYLNMEPFFYGRGLKQG